MLFSKGKKLFFCLFFFCFAYLFFLYHWLSELYPFEAYGFSEFEGVIILILACLFLPAFHALIYALIIGVYRFLPNKSFVTLPALASLWVICEWLMAQTEIAFPWGSMALSQTGFLPFVQTTSLFGSYFITFVAVLSCASIAWFFVNKKRAFLTIGCALLATNTVLGSVLYFIPVQTGGQVSVAIIQGNAASGERWDESRAEQLFARHIGLTKTAAESGADIILLAESSLPYFYYKNGLVYNEFSRIAIENECMIILNVSIKEDGKYYNSMLAINKDGSVSNRYDKHKVVPFGEHIPYGGFLKMLIPALGEMNIGDGDLTAGSECVLIDSEYGKIGTLVCFDSIFAPLAREEVNAGAGLLAVSTNDSWFGTSAGIYQHLSYSKLRAIETGRQVIRAANTGISAYIDQKGRVIQQTKPQVSDILYTDAFFSDTKTLYTYIGDLPLYASFLIVAFGIVLKIIYKYKIGGKNGRNQTL